MKKEKQKKIKLEVQVNLRKTQKYHYVANLANVFFPFEPYPEQLSIVGLIQKAISRGQNALIESPTGTGKTVCLLIGALSSLVDLHSRKKIFYLTRTHSQISQVVAQFKKLSYDCHLNIIASRQHLCINHNLSQLKGKLLDKACQQMCFQKLCIYKDNGTIKIPKKSLDLPQFKEICKKQLVCPYFYSKQLIQKCQLTILPFNYLLDWNLFEGSFIDIKDSIIIFDEAHNIDSLCEQGSDIRLSSDLLYQSVAELKALLRAQSKKILLQKYKQKNEEYLQIQQFKEQVELLLNKIKSISQSSIVYKQDLLHFLEESTTTHKQVGVDLGNFRFFISKGKKIVRSFFKKQMQCQNFQTFLLVFQKCYTIMNNESQFQKFSVSLTKNQLLFRCLDPSLTFARINQSKPKTIILSSGTMGNLDLWEGNLKISFPHKITTQSFITDRQLYAQIIQKSESGVAFNFSFQGKQNQKQYEEITKQLKKLQSMIKGGIIIAFSSYELLQKTLKYCSILKSKLFFETKGGNIDDVFSSYEKEVKQGTAFLFIVIKGRFSEGINFTNELCRCLIVIGIPFLPLKDLGVVEKMKYLSNNSTKQQAEEWYTLQSFKGLNQTLGRAIRNKNDYAVILLFDQRYSKQQNIKYLSKWFLKCLRSQKNSLEEINIFLKEVTCFKEDSEKKITFSTKNKKEPTICERLLQFSTPSKSDKDKKKLKLVLQSQIKQVQSNVKTNAVSNLKPIIVLDDQQPCYQDMKQQLQQYFIDFSHHLKDQSLTNNTSKTSIKNNHEENQLLNELQIGKTIHIMRSYGKCGRILDF